MSITEVRPTAPATRPRSWPAVVAGATAQAFVGGSVAVSAALSGAPLYTAQAVRYGAAALLLLAFVRATGQPLRRPRGVEWLWLLGVVIAGLLVFNVALVRGSRHAEPAVLGVAVACVPVLLAAIGPLFEGSRPGARAVLAAGVVTAGAVLVEGTGRADAIGIGWAVVVFACEAGFTLLALPVLRSQGPAGVSVHTTWIAAVLFAVLGVEHEGGAAVLRIDAGGWASIGYLAVGVTAVAFVLWYSCVRRLGAGRAGLLTGLAPIAAAVIGIHVSGALPGVPVWAGIALIAAGLAAGLG